MKNLFLLMIAGLLSLTPRVSAAHHTQADCPTINTVCLEQFWFASGQTAFCSRQFGSNGTVCQTETQCLHRRTCNGQGACRTSTGSAIPFKPSSTACVLPGHDEYLDLGLCDDSRCSGFSDVCVGHPKVQGDVCRPSVSACDREEYCEPDDFFGGALTCGTDAVSGASKTCRNSVGECDIKEVCDGTSFDCPADEVAPDSTLCRAATDACDVSDFCDGETKTCPDVVVEAGELCRSSTGDCDVEETCDGTSVACPEDALADDSTICDDGDECTDGDSCTLGQCIGDSINNCPAVDVDAGPTAVADAGVVGADSGMVDSDAGTGEAGSDSGTGPEDEMDGGCGCNSSNPNNSNFPFTFLVVLVVLGYFRRQIFSTRN